MNSDTGVLEYQRLSADAVELALPRQGDAGYDLTVISVEKSKHTDDVFIFGTGLAINPPEGYFAELVPRSSISNTGYMLANSVGIIDPNYRGEIKIALRKIEKNAKDIILPCRIAQLILRPIIRVPVLQKERLNETERGAGGFGSTN
jgi:dUTP pyrophosphatase